MFSKKVVYDESVESKKEITRREVEAYRKTEFAAVVLEVAEFRAGKLNEVSENIKECARDMAEQEHEYHTAVQDKKIELAKLDAEIKAKKISIKDNAEALEFGRVMRAERDLYKAKCEAYEISLKTKSESITLLDDIVKVVVGKLSKVDVDKLAVNVTAKTA